jgi:phosphopantothenoylcysteine decarboxylase/phosphopantothenate--cysteine ligase
MTAPRSRRPHVVITAGPTREYLDDVRFLTNASTGRLGIALAREALRRGARVTLILGPTERPPPEGPHIVRVVSTRDLLEAARRAVRSADLVIFAAAPSDLRPARRRHGKPPREAGAREVRLLPTTDVAATLGRRKAGRVHVGFALEVAWGEERARAKMAKKRFDAIVLNSLANFGKGGGKARWIPRGGRSDTLPTASKAAFARSVMTRSWALLPPPLRDGSAGRTQASDRGERRGSRAR